VNARDQLMMQLTRGTMNGVNRVFAARNEGDNLHGGGWILIC
jgi:hypothetical protein